MTYVVAATQEGQWYAWVHEVETNAIAGGEAPPWADVECRVGSNLIRADCWIG